MGEFSWKSVAIWSCLFGAACLIALVMIANKSDASLLSEVALSVALLAFVAQLMLAIAQQAAASQQASRTEEVRSETVAALESIKAASDAIARRQAEQLERMIEHVIDRAVPLDGDTSGEGPGPSSREDLRSRLLSAARREASFSHVWPPLPVDIADSRLELLSTAPTREEGEAAFHSLRELTGDAAVHFTKWAQGAVEDARVTGLLGGWFSKGLYGPANQQLKEAGLLAVTTPPAGRKPPSDESEWVTLTELGLQALRLCLNPWPGWARDMNLRLVDPGATDS